MFRCDCSNRVRLKVLKKGIPMSTLPPTAAFLSLSVCMLHHSQKEALADDPRWRNDGRGSIFQLLFCIAFLFLKT